MNLESPKSQTDAEGLVVSNAAANTTHTKYVQLLNSSPTPTIWSHHQHKVPSISVASVRDVIWRAAKPYLTVQAIDKDLLSILLVWSQFSLTLAYSPATPSDLLINFVFTINQKMATWMKTLGACEFYTTYLSLSRTSP